MSTKRETPSLVSHLGSIAGLYRTVFWMIGQRIHRGRDWEERLTDDALQALALEETEPRDVVTHRN